MFVWGIHCRYSLLQRHSTHEDIRKSVRVDYWVVNPARTSPGSMFELWISDGFELFFAVHFLYPKFVLARSKQLMPVTVKFKIDVLVCGLQGHLFPSVDDGPMFPCSKNVTHCRKEVYSTCLSEESMPFVKSKPPLPSRSLRSLRAAARSTSSLHIYFLQKIELWYPRCGLQDIDCDLGCIV